MPIRGFAPHAAVRVVQRRLDSNHARGRYLLPCEDRFTIQVFLSLSLNQELVQTYKWGEDPPQVQWRKSKAAEVCDRSWASSPWGSAFACEGEGGSGERKRLTPRASSRSKPRMTSGVDLLSRLEHLYVGIVTVCDLLGAVILVEPCKALTEHQS